MGWDGQRYVLTVDGCYNLHGAHGLLEFFFMITLGNLARGQGFNITIRKFLHREALAGRHFMHPAASRLNPLTSFIAPSLRLAPDGISVLLYSQSLSSLTVSCGKLRREHLERF